jgi:hypothetical protein
MVSSKDKEPLKPTCHTSHSSSNNKRKDAVFLHPADVIPSKSSASKSLSSKHEKSSFQPASSQSKTSDKRDSKSYKTERSREVSLKSKSSSTTSPEKKKRRLSSTSNDKEMKAKVANKVVAYLMLHYKGGKIMSRPLFKVIAKHLSDRLESRLIKVRYCSYLFAHLLFSVIIS